MRIILITSKLNFVTAGGSVIDLHLKAKGLVELGHQVTVITAYSSANKITETLPYAVKEENIAAASFASVQYKVYHMLRKYESEADVFYIDGNNFLYGGGMFRMLGGRTPVVAFFNIKLSCWSDTQDNYKKKQTLFAKIKRRARLLVEKYIGVKIANRMDAFIFTTPMVEKLCLDFGFKKSNSNVIPDFVSTREIIDKQNLAAGFINKRQTSAEITIFCSGRMIVEKGFDLVIKAFSLIKDKSRMRVIMSGGGPDAERLQKLTVDLGLQNFFSFPGWVEKSQLEKFFQQAHIFILPKWWPEYTSVLLIEAMAYGLPCIVPGGGGLEWLVEKGGLTFIADNAVSLAQRIEELANDGELRISLTKNILTKAKELDYKNLAVRMEQVMRLVVSARNKD